MSHLARELDRHLEWIESQAEALQEAIEQLYRQTNALMNQHAGWNDEQAHIIRRAIADWGDNCGRSILHACDEVRQFREHLLRASTKG
ncbi:hypothetical protein [Actinophytocola algeriensis]|uniref:Prephenate dehydratase n=1 Tax=Actinophytocola algeriensis TaxID=1768010 RepID=A0A7W7QBW8_9PSEU|nr:hypothetical protein [Actinophytocola algeriensis]MBB4910598.1 prephenate dehydratase [Actinophytocola algeriensis]MBE1480414.1 prephenate dehydratase [Actinophytocola algeriensis]